MGVSVVILLLLSIKFYIICKTVELPSHQRRNTNHQKAHKNTLNINNVRRMQIETTMGYYFSPLRIDSYQKKRERKIASTEEDVEKLEHLCTTSGNIF